MFETKVIKTPIKLDEAKQMAIAGFGDRVKAVVDVEQQIMALGSELHVDSEAVLIGEHGSSREHTWGINIYPEKSGEDYVEFDSMVNIKPGFGNRNRGVSDPEIREKIKKIVAKLIENNAA